MPAGTVEDLIEFNRDRPEDKKVLVRIDKTYSNINVVFSMPNGKGIETEFSSEVIEYYEGVSPEQIKGPISRTIFKTNKKPFPYGHATMVKINYKSGPCRDAYIVESIAANKGWGVFLYEILIELAGKRGVTPDRKLVSPTATNVWRTFLNTRAARGEIEVKILDPIEDPSERGKITPDYRFDDCVSKHSHNPDWNIGIDDPNKKPEIENILNQVYYNKSINIIQRLKTNGLLYIGSPPQQNENISKKLLINQKFLHELYNSLKYLK